MHDFRRVGLEWAKTRDGWELPLYRWRPQTPRFKHPLLMLHGLGANRLNIDLDRRYSVAQAAQERGFEVFVAELRGSGASKAPEGKPRTQFQWGLGEYLEIDVPALVARVQQETGGAQMHAFGHSMGGMLLYGMAANQNEALRSVTAVAAPLVRKLKLAARERRMLTLGQRLGSRSIKRRLPLKRLMGAAGHFIPLSSRLVDGILLDASNVEPEILARMAREAISDIPVQLIYEITRQMNLDEDAPSAPPYDYEERLGDARVPMFLVAGGADRVAPPNSVAAAAGRLGSDDVRYREMGILAGDAADYGHVDILVGRHAPDEVFPLLLDFMEEKD